MSNTFDKLSVLDSFIEEVNSYLPEIETHLGQLAQSPGDMDALEETYRRTHTIGGSASMMDFPGLAHVAHGMEDILGDALEELISIDEFALGLLNRSLGRLHRLLEGIRNGIDEESVIAEDDADYAHYRSQIESSGFVPSQEETRSDNDSYPQSISPSTPASPFQMPEMPAPPSSPVPSFDEVLASFRTPAFQPGEEVSWPEDPAPTDHFEAVVPPASSQDVNAGFTNSHETVNRANTVNAAYTTDYSPAPFSSPTGMTSAFEALMTSTRRNPENSAPPSYDAPFSPPSYDTQNSQLVDPPPATPNPAPPLSASVQSDQYSYIEPATNIASTYRFWEATQSTPALPAQPVEPQPDFAPDPVSAASNAYDVLDDTALMQTVAPSQILPQPASLQSLPASFEAVQKSAQAIEQQAASLQSFVSQLHDAMSVIDTQRGEFKGFLDGSKDALDRMEVWAGKAMGLNLRNSPEQVRRYLPLSVMWVANSKLKKVLDSLQGITSGAQATDEQVALALDHLYASLQDQGEAFQAMQDRSDPVFEQEAGWSPWEVRTTHNPQTLRESVTFERQGDPTKLRAELEQQIREELRQEFEAHLQEQEHLKSQFTDNGGNAGNVREMEAQLRSEIEIQVRQEFLNQIMTSEAAKAAKPAPSVVANSPVAFDYEDYARDKQANQSPTGGTSNTSVSMPPEPKPAPKPSLSSTPLPSQRPANSSTTYNNDFGEEAAEIFRMEAEEHLQTISMNVAALEKHPDNHDLIQSIRRTIHTLKGAAGMMGFHAIADLAHVSEDLLDMIMEGKIAISDSVLSIILDTAEALDMLINAKDGDEVRNDAHIQSLHLRYIEVLGDNVTSMTQHLLEEDLDDEDHDPHQVTSVVTDEAGVTSPPQTRRDLSVRVGLQRLDELVNLFGELLVNRSVLEERIQRLVHLVSDVSVSSNRLRDVGQKLDSRFEAATLPSGRSVQVMPGEGDQSIRTGLLKNGSVTNIISGTAHLQEFDELELDRYTEFHQLARGLSEGISDMTTLSTEMDTIIRECESVFSRENRLSTTFQDRLMKTRLVPITNMAPRLYRAARAVALKQGKDIEFLLEGQATEVDRTVFEEIGGPLLHLVRNAVNHAIEKPALRMQKGKSPIGQVILSAAYEGNQIVITVRDDGTGLDRESIRQTAIIRGLIRPDQQLTENDVVSLIFHPGFSTASVLSEESGRGVGLDVVRDSVSRLRGTLVVESTPNQGTAFTMTFPTSVAIQRAMMVRVSGQQFAIPTVNVESIGRLDNFKRSSLGGQPAVLVRNELYPLQMLARHMGLSASSVDSIEDKAQIILVNAGGRRVALVIDEIKGQFDIVMKNLGPHLRQVHGIAGATVLGNGHVVLILELNDLLSLSARGNIGIAPIRRDAVASPASSNTASAAMKQLIDVKSTLLPQQQNTSSQRPAVPSAPATAERGKHLLVVDDSPSVRRVVSNMLKQHNWEVQMARDGVEALEMITAQAPAAVLLDIEMPRMDGYELISTVRAQEQYRTLPLIVLTSRAASKHQQRAMLLGANAYVVKPYQDEELLRTINTQIFGTGASPSTRVS